MALLSGLATVLARRHLATTLNPTILAAFYKPLSVDKPNFELMRALHRAGLSTCPMSGMPVFDPDRASPTLRTAIWKAYCGIATTVNEGRLGATDEALEELRAQIARHVSTAALAEELASAEEPMEEAPASSSGGSEQLLPAGAAYFEGWVTDPSAIVTELSSIEMMHYPFRGKCMKRAPKREFFFPGHEDATYKWGQETSAYPGGSHYSGLPMPTWMQSIADRIRSEFDEEVNHAIAIRYTHGTENHAPPHQDKIDPDTSFFVLSFGTPRNFQLLSQVQPFQIVHWEKPLAHGSLLVISGALNQTHHHAVPKDKEWQGQDRWSLIFRTIR